MRMAKIEADKVVTLVYTLKDDDGNVIEDRTPESPFIYMHGHDQILPALEEALEGQSIGYCTFLRLTPERGFGEYREELVAEVSHEQFPNQQVNEGMKFDTVGPNGQPLTVSVLEINGDQIIVDGNHPLAGVSLNFDLRVIEVRDPSVEEAEGEVELDVESPEAETSDGTSKTKSWLH